MIEIGLILLSVGIVLTTIATLLYNNKNDRKVLIIFGIGWFLIIISAFFIGRYVVNEFGWYVI